MNFSNARPVQRGAAVSPVAGESLQPPSLRELFGVLARRRLTILAMIVLASVFAAVYLVKTPPRFTATTTMILDTKRMPLFQNDAVVEGPVDQAAIESQVETIKSDKVSSQVIRKLGLLDDPEFVSPSPGFIGSLIGKAIAIFDSIFAPSDGKGGDGGHSGDSAEARAMRTATAVFNSGLKVTHLPRTYTVEIAFTSLDRQKAMKIANETAEAYINDQLEAKYEVTRRSGSWLQQRIEELRGQASKAYKAVQDFKTENNIIIDTQGKLGSDREMDELTNALGRARTEVSTAEAKLQRIENVLKAGTVTGAQDPAVADVLNNPIITALRGRYLDAQKREMDWSARYGKNHLATINQRNEMAGLEHAIIDEVKRIAETYKSEVEIRRTAERSIEKRLNEVFQRASSTRQSQVRLRELETQATTFQTIFETFLTRYTQAVQQQSFPTTEARVITPASLPETKSAPKTNLTLFLALVAGAFLGVGAAFVQEHLDRVLRTRQQLEGTLGVDCLAVLPRVDKADERGLILVDDNDPFSHIAEALRAVKVAIDINQMHNQTNVVGIVSAFPGEGKTTFSANLAEIIGKAGRKTLLIDADLRNPSLTRALTQGRQPGLLEAMAGVQKISECITKSASPNFDLLGGTLQARLVHTADILSSLGMKALIESARHDYEYIIIDLPPLLPLADVRGAAHLIGSFILVTEWGQTTIDDVKNALATSSVVSERLLGAVLNKADTKVMRRFEGYGRRTAAYYYGAPYGKSHSD
jgi:capsular exopolysaccharide synthesis family protein